MQREYVIATSIFILFFVCVYLYFVISDVENKGKYTQNLCRYDTEITEQLTCNTTLIIYGEKNHLCFTTDCVTAVSQGQIFNCWSKDECVIEFGLQTTVSIIFYNLLISLLISLISFAACGGFCACMMSLFLGDSRFVDLSRSNYRHPNDNVELDQSTTGIV